MRFHTTGEYDHAFAIRDEMYGEMERILKAAGAEILPYKKVAPYPLGSVTHEAGGARMGDDPKTSVLDALEPLPRHQESAGGGCGLLPIAPRKTSHPHDYGAGLPRRGSPGRANPNRKCVAAGLPRHESSYLNVCWRGKPPATSRLLTLDGTYRHRSRSVKPICLFFPGLRLEPSRLGDFLLSLFLLPGFQVGLA